MWVEAGDPGHEMEGDGELGVVDLQDVDQVVATRLTRQLKHGRQDVSCGVNSSFFRGLYLNFLDQTQQFLQVPEYLWASRFTAV